MSGRHILFMENGGQALQRLMPHFADHHDDWEIVLVNDAVTALSLLSQRDFATVVANFDSDLAGCEQFLHDTRHTAPAAIRYALLPAQPGNNGTDVPESAYQCYPTHCTYTELEAAIQRGLGVWRQCRENPGLTRLLANLRKIPTPPALYFEIREELASQESDAMSIAGIIARDPAIVAKILKVANSGFYAIPRSITDIHEAIIYLGTDTVTSLVLAAHMFDRMPAPGINLDSMWRHSLMVSALARHIATEEGGDRLTVNTAGVAGLLHDIGQLTLLSNVAELYQPMLRAAGGDESALLEMEREQFGVGHAELGSYVLGLWSLPDAVVDAVALHHSRPQDGKQPATLINRAVFSAEWVLKQLAAPDIPVEGEQPDYPFDTSQEQIEGWRGVCAAFAQ